MKRPLKRIFLAFFAIVLLAGGNPLAAHETDHYTIPPGRDFADLGPYFTRFFYDGLQRAVIKLNQQIDAAPSDKEAARLQSTAALADAVFDALPDAYTTIEGIEKDVHSANLGQQYPGRVVGYKNQFKASYEHLPFDPRQIFKFWFASQFKAYGTYMGGDKIGHFIDMGKNYHDHYTKALAAGKSEAQAHAAIIDFATNDFIFSESGVLGYLSAGAYSNADLASNYAGYLFYRNLSEPVTLKGQVRPPLMVREGKYWRLADHVGADSDFLAWFVSAHWDEALNPSDYDGLMRGGVRDNIRARAAIILWRYRDEHDRPRPPRYFHEMAERLRKFEGADYGQRGDFESLLTIDEVCYGDVAKKKNAPAVCPLGHTALHEAALRGDLAEVTKLLDQGAAIDVEIGLVKPFAPDLGATPLQLAAAGGYVDVVRLLLARGAQVDATDRRGATALHRACGDAAVTALLLENKADVGATDLAGQTALHWAAADENGAQTVAILLQHGALSGPDHLGRTPLHEAARLGRAEAAAALSNGENLQGADQFGMTALHLAAQGGHADIITQLITAGAPTDGVDAFGYTALHVAAAQGGSACVQALLKGGAMPAARDNQGVTPLHLAARYGRRDAVTALLRAGANPDGAMAGGLEVTNGSGENGAANQAPRTPLHEATLADDAGAVQALLFGGANVNAKDATGKTPRQLAEARGHREIIMLFIHTNLRADATPHSLK